MSIHLGGGNRGTVQATQSPAPIPNATRHLVALTVLLLISLTVNVLLALDNVRYRSAGRARMDTLTFMREGNVAPPFDAKRLDGTATTIVPSEASVPTVLYAFTPQCHWCTKNLDNVRAVVRGAKGRMRFVGVALSRVDLTEYLEQTEIPFDEVVIDPTSETMSKYQLYGTPRMIVLNTDSTVARLWNGAVTSDVSDDVAGYFGVALPGLRESAEWRISR